MLEAAEAAAVARTPWVLDPVAIGALPVRTALAGKLAGLRPTVVRGNASEIIALAGAGGGGRGVDSADSVEAALPAAASIAGDDRGGRRRLRRRSTSSRTAGVPPGSPTATRC